MMPLGLLIAGPVTDTIGYQSWFWVAGILNLLIGAIGFFIPALMNIENNHKPTRPELTADTAENAPIQ